MPIERHRGNRDGKPRAQCGKPSDIGGLSALLKSRPPQHVVDFAALLRGGMPGSKVDLSSRIDFPQHAGGGLLRYLRMASEQGFLASVPQPEYVEIDDRDGPEKITGPPARRPVKSRRGA